MRTFFLTFIFLFSAASLVAQEKVVISNDPPPPAARYPVVSEKGNAQVLYNAKKGETIARTKSLLVYGRDMEGLSLAAEFISKGEKVAEPSTVTLKIFYMGTDRIFVDDRTIKIFVDNNELIAATSKFIGANESNVILARLEEDIPFSKFTTISRSANVRMQVGPATFVLIDRAVQGFSDLIQTIER